MRAWHKPLVCWARGGNDRSSIQLDTWQDLVAADSVRGRRESLSSASAVGTSRCSAPLKLALGRPKSVIDMDRRMFLKGASMFLAAAPTVDAQPVGKARIGYLSHSHQSDTQDAVDAFRVKLGDIGYREGQNLVIESR